VPLGPVLRSSNFGRAKRRHARGVGAAQGRKAPGETNRMVSYDIDRWLEPAAFRTHSKDCLLLAPNGHASCIELKLEADTRVNKSALNVINRQHRVT
jgi:hypothetical protein